MELKYIILSISISLIFIFTTINSNWESYKFNKEVGSYCKLAFDSSDINIKIKYFETCSSKIHQMKFRYDNVRIFFEKPSTSAKENLIVMDSLLTRMKDLSVMNKSSFEYQTGMAQVEDEIEHFNNETLDIFKILWCYDNSITRFAC